MAMRRFGFGSGVRAGADTDVNIVWADLPAIVLALTLFAWLSGACQAKTITLCVLDSPFPPFSYPDREGLAQRWVRLAIEKQGWQMASQIAPVNRCRASMKLGEVDAAATFVPTAANREVVVFPLRLHPGDQVDPGKSLGAGKGFAYRRIGSNAGWDGVKFSNVSLPILFQLGVSVAQVKLAALNVPHRDSAKSTQQLFRMLLLERADIILGKEVEADGLMQTDEFRGKIEKLPIPVISTEFYLVFSKQFYQREPALVEQIWADLRDIKEAGPAAIPTLNRH